MHHETIGASATAPSTGAAMTALSGDSLTVRNARPGSKVRLLAAWGMIQTAGSVKIVAPNFNDTTRGIMLRTLAGSVVPLLATIAPQELIPQDLLTLTIIGSATGGDVENIALTLQYDDMPGIAGRYLDRAELESRAVRAVTVYASITTTTGPGWTGSEALNAESDLLRPNKDYALVGGVVGAACLGLGVRSPDWGNVRVAIPGSATQPDVTNDWFARLSDSAHMPLIPILNSGNKTGILIDAASDENAAAVPFSLHLVELS